MFGQLATVCVFVGMAVAAPTGGPLQWTSCSADPANTAMTVNFLDIQPNPVPIPGDVHFSINVTVNRPINHLFIDVELYQQGILGEVKLPCIGDTNIGSCDNIDSCTILDRVLNGSSVVSQGLGQQIDSMLLTALGHQAQCPIQPETVFVSNHKLTLSPLPAALSLITSDSTYRVKIIVKDDPTSSDNVGCLEFTAGLATPAVIG